jgi:hypothetical protein
MTDPMKNAGSESDDPEGPECAATSDQSDARARTATRLLLMYNLEVGSPVELEDRPLSDVLEFGRLAEHVMAGGPLLPKVVREVSAVRIDLCVRLADPRMRPLVGTVVVVATPRRDVLLLLDVEVDVPQAADIAVILFETWRHRAEITIDGVGIEVWLRARLPSGGARDDGVQVKLGRNVHQWVFPGGELAARLIETAGQDEVPAELEEIVLRGTLEVGGGGASLGVRRPDLLNKPSRCFVAHGRGVSVIAGWSAPLENSFALAALGILNAVAAIHRVRRHAFDALELNETANLNSVAEARRLLSRLSHRLTELQLDLAFSVEAYADSILIPELVLDSYSSSLREVSGLPDGIANTSRIVDKVTSAIRARRVLLDAASQEQDEARDKVFTTIVAVATVFALPPALILAFFGANVPDIDPRRSIFDFGHYGGAYLLAWLPFVTIVVVAIVRWQQIRDRVPDVYTLDDGDEVPTTEPAGQVGTSDARWIVQLPRRRAGALRQPRPH